MALVDDRPSPLIVHMRLQAGWNEAVGRLRSLREEQPERLRLADSYGSKYLGARGAMVFDVVASHRRRYRTVESAVEQFVRSGRT